MAAFKFLLIVSFYRFLIEKCNCTADKRHNWHWCLPTAWSSVDVEVAFFSLSHILNYWCSSLDICKINKQRYGLARKGNGIIIVTCILA